MGSATINYRYSGPEALSFSSTSRSGRIEIDIAPNTLIGAYTLEVIALEEAAGVTLYNRDGTISRYYYYYPAEGLPTRHSLDFGRADFQVVAPQFPVITAQSQSKTVNVGTHAGFLVVAPGNPMKFVWTKDGVIIPREGQSSISLPSVFKGDAGTYAVTVSNSVGSVTSEPMVLTVVDPNPGRLINLSVLSNITKGDSQFTVGTAIGGTGTSGRKQILIRAAGPALVPFNVSGALPDPKLTLMAGPSTRSDDSWNSQLTEDFAAVGAFAFAPGSKDAAMLPTLDSGGHTILINDSGGGTGTVLAEIYDATSSTVFNPSTPRLINVSVLKKIASGEHLTAGFVVGGKSDCTVLIRAMGPSLAQFQVGGPMADPQLSLFREQTIIGANNDWNGLPSLANACKAVGAFAPDNASSKDAILLVTLQPGSYSVQATGVAGDAGAALIEVYEVP